MAGLSALADIATIVGTGFAVGAALWAAALRPLNEKVVRIDGAVAAIRGKVDKLETDMAHVSGQVEAVTDAVVPLLADHYAGDPQKVAGLLSAFHPRHAT